MAQRLALLPLHQFLHRRRDLLPADDAVGLSGPRPDGDSDRLGEQHGIQALLGVERVRDHRHTVHGALQRRIPAAVREEAAGRGVGQHTDLRRPRRHHAAQVLCPFQEALRKQIIRFSKNSLVPVVKKAAFFSLSLGRLTTQRKRWPLASSPSAISCICSVDREPPLPKDTNKTESAGCRSSHSRHPDSSVSSEPDRTIGPTRWTGGLPASTCSSSLMAFSTSGSISSKLFTRIPAASLYLQNNSLLR
ncbi:hypothetical protein ACMD2_01567 [Ananas comosus]|uniref:Uncharacterized protein n=1 Tax=Ananas comosus TaxID=4615 RepID=A0A199W0E7_ANACO|nr:hypothetical protein ACMD2_01567 [Ananas comosus]